MLQHLYPFFHHYLTFTEQLLDQFFNHNTIVLETLKFALLKGISFKIALSSTVKIDNKNISDSFYK